MRAIAAECSETDYPLEIALLHPDAVDAFTNVPTNKRDRIEFSGGQAFRISAWMEGVRKASIRRGLREI